MVYIDETLERECILYLMHSSKHTGYDIDVSLEESTQSVSIVLLLIAPKCRSNSQKIFFFFSLSFHACYVGMCNCPPSL